MREVKEPDIRRAEIMNMAKHFFMEKGYVETTTQDIVKGCKISRGLFYYYFKSKKDILDAIVDEEIEGVLERLRRVAYDKSLSAKEKVRSFINFTMIEDTDGAEANQAIQEAMELPENNYMLDMMNRKLSYALTTYFKDILKQGNEEGVFNIDYPQEIAAFLMAGYSSVANDVVFHNNEIHRMKQYIKAYKQMLNKILIKDGDIFE